MCLWFFGDFGGIFESRNVKDLIIYYLNNCDHRRGEEMDFINIYDYWSKSYDMGSLNWRF